VSERLLAGEPFVAVARADNVESVHDVAACAIDASGQIALAMGAIDTPVYLRSTAKPFIAAAAVREGVVERFGLVPREIAIMAASHNGEPDHIDAVRSILGKIGVSEDALKCGAHPPYDPQAARDLERAGVAYSAIHNNCSGKHAGILALCRVLDAGVDTYLEVGNAAEQRILALCARMCGQSVADLPLGIDGCGVPVFATSLRHAARAFSRLATLDDVDAQDARALRTVRDAMIAFPWYVAGTGEFDTALMDAGGGNLLVKSGAEAVVGVSELATGTGMVLKVVDGSSRACAPAAIAILERLGLLRGVQLDALKSFAHPALYNRAGRLVGSISALASRQATKRST
jgi:L-asparaginase II